MKNRDQSWEKYFMHVKLGYLFIYLFFNSKDPDQSDTKDENVARSSRSVNVAFCSPTSFISNASLIPT